MHAGRLLTSEPGGFSEERHDALKASLSQLRWDLAENLEIPATCIQLQFSHTGLLCEGVGDGVQSMYADAEEEVPVTSWMAVEVQITPVQPDPASGMPRHGPTPQQIRRQHADIAACIVAALSDPASSLRHSASMRGWRHARLVVAGRIRTVTVEIEPLDDFPPSNQPPLACLLSVTFDDAVGLTAVERPWGVGQPSSNQDLALVIAEWTLFHLHHRHCGPNGFRLC